MSCTTIEFFSIRMKIWVKPRIPTSIVKKQLRHKLTGTRPQKT